MNHASIRIKAFSICFLLFGTSCTSNTMRSPHAAPVSVLRNDQYIYPFGKFYAASGKSVVHLGFVHPSPNAPIVWNRGEPIDVTVDTPEAIIERCGEPDDKRYERFSYHSKEVGAADTSTVIYLRKPNEIETIAIGKEGGISLTKDSEVLTIPFSREDLIRVFGQPNEFIESK